MPSPRDPAEHDGSVDAAEMRLIRLCQKGDRAAFDELVTRYQARVFNLAYRLTGDPDDAADLAQETFVRVYRGIGSFHGGSALTTWIYRIVHNLCLDDAKRRRRRPQIAAEPTDGDEPSSETVLDRAPDESSEPQRVILSEERCRLVRAAIARLRGHHREVLVMYDLEGLSYNEIADLLNTNVGTIKSRLNRARYALAKELGADLELFE